MYQYQMKVNGLGCTFHMPPAVKSKVVEGKEVVHGLPPCKQVRAYAVDEYPAAQQKNWMNGSAKAGSYFVGVKEDYGMWLDLNACNSHTYHVAAVISIQGVNPITGLPQNKLVLEQYNNKCPKHDVKFKQDRYCPECKYKWPKQNYLCTNGLNMPNGYFWLDGFHDEDGTVRQYIITLEKIRSVAANILGDERVFAIGIAFFLSKTEKPKPVSYPSSSFLLGASASDNSLKKYFLHHTPSVNNYYDPDGGPILSSKGPMLSSNVSNDNGKIRYRGANMLRAVKPASFNPDSFNDSDRLIGSSGLDFDDAGNDMKGFDSSPEIETTKVEIGAGARINQQVYDDPEKIDFWQDEPAGCLYINYLLESEVAKIINAGKRVDKEGGFLNEIPVGNP